MINKKYYLAFDKHLNVEMKMKKIGFLQTKNDSENSIVYLWDNSEWIEIQPTDYYEGFIIFMRCPILTFNENWNLYVYSKDDDNMIGSLSFIINNYSNELIEYLKEIVKHKIDSKTKNSLKQIQKYILPYYQDTIETMKKYGGCKWETISDILKQY